jgi:molybdenum cofactor biosynthesis enzyme MoaA
VINRGSISAADFKLDSVDVYLTSFCNRRCTYCFLPDSYFDSRIHMPAETVEAIVGWAAQGAEEITLLGGEPALHPAFAEIVVRTAGTPIRVRTVTNGSHRFRAAFRRDDVRAALDRVAVSLDAPSAAIVDRLRGRGAYKDVLVTIDELRAANMPFDLNCTVVASTLDSVPDLLAFADDCGAERLNMHWFSPVGRARLHAPDEVVGAHDWRTRVLDVVRAYRPRRTGFFADCQIAFAYGDVAGESDDMCAVRDRTNLQFLPSGAVFSCGMLLEQELFSGYLWSEHGLITRPGETEVSRTAATCTGCPVREDTAGHTPICIYNRMV